jgi:hypothetical protein
MDARLAAEVQPILEAIPTFSPLSAPLASYDSRWLLLCPTVIVFVGYCDQRSAWLSFFGLSSDSAEPKPVSAMNYLALVAPILGVVAIVLSLISGVLRENWRYPVYAAGLGASAILFHFFWWMALLLAGVLLLIAIIENIGDTFSFG